jgi:hypothetical protein
MSGTPHPEERRQEIPENLSEDGRYLRIYGVTSHGRRYLNHRQKLSKGEIEYFAWLKEKRTVGGGG